MSALAAEWDRDAPGRRFQEIDGSLVFADISGFTSLSERLASNGRIGAEELTEVLNRVFGSMISLGHLRGGHLLKFGGDALLFLFQGADHALQACSAAVEMRAALRESARIQTSCGRVPLRMSVGVHSGLIHLFLVGGSHRELVLAGPSASTTIAMEGTAEAGQIVISAGTRNRLPSGAPMQPKGEGFLLPWRTARTEPAGPRERRETSPGVIARCLPTILRDHLAGAGIESEHRMAVVSFVKFVGTDDRWVAEGSDGVADALHELVCAVQTAAEEQRVTFMASDVDQDGGKLILATGLPTSGEDDERRMLRAVRAVLASDLPLAVKAGINRGHVFVGEIGTDFRSTFTLMGDTVNLAARVMAAAAAGSVYATPGVLDRSATLFAAAPLEPFPVKGKTDLVQAYAVGEEIGPREVRTLTELPFRGRDDSLAVLEAAVRESADGISNVIDVVGEAGVGKSRLVREALAGSGVPTLTLRGEHDARANPYRAMRDAARTLLGLRTDVETPLITQLVCTFERMAPHLQPMLPLVATVCHLRVDDTAETKAIAPEFRADQTADVFIELVRLLVPGRGNLLIEDAQWMDDASAHLLHRISIAAREHGWLFVVTRRRAEHLGFRPENARQIMLDPLDDAIAADLVIGATAAAPLRPHDVDALVQRAAGNPLFLEAMLTAIRERGGSELPDSLDALLAAQMDAMPPLSRTILRHASVLGSSTSTTVLRQLLATEGIVLDDATRETLREHLVDDGGGRIRFRSVMVRDAAYASLAFRRRREIHSTAAQILGSQARPEEVADRLALHHLRAQEYDRAWHFARIAGEHAQRAAANEAAALQYEHALAAASSLPDVDDRDLVDVWTRLGDVRVAAGVFDAGLQAYTRAAKLSHGDSLTHAEMLLRRARAQERAGRFSDALRTTARIRTLTEAVAGAEPVRARALSFRCVVRSAQERFSDIIPVALAAITAADSCGEKQGLAEALKALAWANRMLGRPEVEPHALRALALYEELGDLDGQGKVHGDLGGNKFFSGEWEAALEHYERAEQAFRMIGDTVRAAMIAASVGEIRVSQGRFEDAKPHLTVAARTMRASGFVDGATFAEINLARVYMGQECLPEAIALLDQVIAEVDELGLTSSSLEASIYRSECDIRLGRPAEALRRLTASKRAAGSETAVFGAGLARVDALGLAALGETGLALDRLEQGIEIAREQGLVYELALLYAVRDQLSEEIYLTDAATTDELLARLGVQSSAHLLTR